MRIRQEMNRYHHLLNRSMDLLQLRLQLIRMDTRELLGGLFRLCAAVMFSVSAIFAAFISLLFALDNILPESAKAWVFGLTALVVLLSAVWIMYIFYQRWQQQYSRFSQSLDGIRQDLSLIRGMQPNAAPENQSSETES